MSLLENIKITPMTRGDTALAASNVDSTVYLDMTGYDGVMYIVSVVESTAGGDTGTVMLLPRYGTSTTGLSDHSTSYYTGTTALSTKHWKHAVAVDVVRPRYRYSSISLDKTGSNTVMTGPVIAIQYKGVKGAVTQSTALVVDSNTFATP